MRRASFLIALVLLLGISISGPFFEAVDHWDNFPQSGNDIILTIAMVATLFALFVCTTMRLVRLIRSILRAARANALVSLHANSDFPLPVLVFSPPKLFASSLRI